MALAGWTRESFEAEVSYSGRPVSMEKKRKVYSSLKI
jgi:hypothetical protein